MPSVYKIVNKINNKIYIGSTTNEKRRWKSHRDYLKRNIHHCVQLQNSWNTYGPSNFYFEIIEKTNVEDLLIREQYWIDHYRAYDKDFGFNTMRFVLLGSKKYSKISEEDAKTILELIQKRELKRAIAKRFNVSPQTISDISAGRSWAYLPRGKIRWNRWRKIPDEDVEKIKEFSNNKTEQEIADIYHVHQSTISRIICGLRRKEARYVI